MSKQSQIVNLSFLYAYGCLPEYSSATEITISSGQIRDITNTFDIVVPNTLTVSTAFVGAGGLDIGTIAANTFYAVYILFDSSNQNNPVGLISAVSKNPVMPSVNGATYSNYRVVGYVKTDGSGNILPFRTVGRGTDRKYYWDDNQTLAGVGNDTTYTPVSLSAAVPSILGLSDIPQVTIELDLVTAINPFAAGNYLSIVNIAETANTLNNITSASVAGIAQWSTTTVSANFTVTEDYRIKYLVANAGDSAAINVSAFSYSI